MTLHAYRGEILSIAHDPLNDADAIRHEADGLLLVEDGIVVARGPYADLAPIHANVAVEPLPGLIVPGFVEEWSHG